MRYSWLVLILLMTPGAVGAAEVGPCGGLDRISFLVGQTKSYAEGKVRSAYVDTDGEPVCCSSHLLIFIPSREIGSQCFAVSQKAGEEDKNGEQVSSARGFSSVDFDKIEATYDQAKGLLLNVPYTLYTGDGHGKPGSTKVRVNLRGDGSVKIER